MSTFPSHEWYDEFPELEEYSRYIIDDVDGDTDTFKCRNNLYLLPHREISKIAPIKCIHRHGLYMNNIVSWYIIVLLFVLFIIHITLAYLRFR